MCKNREENQGERFEQFMCGLLTAYRWVPLLASIMREQNQELRTGMWDQLVYKMCAEMNIRPGSTECSELELMLRAFVTSNGDWIDYTLADMSRYAHKILLKGMENKQIELKRYDSYPGRMEQQQKFLRWNPEAFSIDDDGVSIIDIGCGSFPYYKLFDNNNPTLDKYLGVDKRSMEETLFNAPCTFDENRVFFHQLDVVLGNKAVLKDLIIPDVLFMGEFIHCVIDPYLLILDLLNLFPSIHEIRILEVSLDNQGGLGQAFEFHMQEHVAKHTFSAKRLPELASKLNMDMKTRAVSSQHVMYILEKK